MSVTNQELKVAALRLRNASPEGWDQFLVLFSAYTDEAMRAVTEADSGSILVKQGHAQDRLALLRIFNECDQVVKKSTP